MRKIGIILAVVVMLTLIALAVRSQMHASAEDEVSLATAAEPVAADSSTVVATPVIDSIAAGDTVSIDATSRPVFSGAIPTTVAAPAAQEQAQDGAAVLKRAAAAYANVKALRADFVQQRENALLGSTTTSRGTIYQRSPDRFLLEFSEPAGDVIVGDGRYFWIYYPSVDRKQVLRAPAAAGGASGVDLRSQFLGDPLQRFQHTYHGTATVDGRKLHVLTLVPRNSGAGYRSLKVWVDDKDYLTRRFIITEPSGAVADFRLNNLAVNPSLSDALFRFTPPAGAHIVER